MIDDYGISFSYERDNPEVKQNFTKCHELGHFLLGHSGSLFTELKGGSDSKHETIADIFSATILNASAQTNFVYTVSGLTDDEISEVNKIDTNKKLRDRLSKIRSLGGNIEFVKVENQIFENNLRFIDSYFPQAIGETLLRFYESDTSNLLDLFLQTNTFSDIELSSFKLKEFLKAVSFGMLPSEPWNGVYQADGGIVIVSKDSNIYVLDNIYHSEIVAEYLIQETKLETPRTSRYHMLELTKDELTNEVSFTLNLQVRYKQ